MAKLRNIVHSEDACTIIFEGEKTTPEPATGIIKFPGGHVEVSRTSTGTYWAHIAVDHYDNIKDSRIDYDCEGWKEHGIPAIPGQERIQQFRLCTTSLQPPVPRG